MRILNAMAQSRLWAPAPNEYNLERGYESIIAATWAILRHLEFGNWGKDAEDERVTIVFYYLTTSRLLVLQLPRKTFPVVAFQNRNWGQSNKTCVSLHKD